MRLNLRNPISKAVQWLAIFALILAGHVGWSQCNNTSQFGTATAPTNNTPVTITTCAFAGEYSTINSAVAGTTYLFNATGGAGNFITIRQGTPGGAVLGFGVPPISVVCTASGPLYLHYNTNSSCGTDVSCHTGTIQCTSCSGGSDPCTTIPTIACATSVTATTSGAGIWSPGTCGFSTPGQEKVYSFTPTTTGLHILQVTSTSNTGYIDYFYKTASGGCNGTGWTCIRDIFSPTTVNIGTLTAGTTYYFLLDAETTSSVTQTFQINCPASFNPCTTIPTMVCATPVTATPSGAGVWSPGTCGFSTPGQERVYAFTPIVTGAHSLQVTAASGGYIDYFYKVASGGCNATGWTCILDISSPTTVSMGTLTAGTTYYILLDPEGTGAYSHTFQVLCPASAPPCVASPSSPTNGQTNICPSPTQALSWPASPGATSYDVYFGTTGTPPFVANTASTSYTASTPTSGTYFWQIRPVGPNGTATGCTIWSFTKIDNTLPNITCPANIAANNSPATACSAVVNYATPTASDNCGLAAGQPTLIGGLASGATYPVGTTTNTWRALDVNGNTRTCSFTVTISDVTLPNITCPANIAKNNDVGVCGASTTYATPSASDNCGLAAGSPSLQSGLASGSVFPVGTTTNVWRATDLSNNTRTCSFTVTVTDNELPKITCPPAILKGNDFGSCGASIPQLGSAFPVTDNCVVQNVSNNSPGFFPVGTTSVVWTARDNSNNTNTCAQLVTVEDREFPVLICPSNINVKTNVGDCVATVGYAANGSDNCSGLTVEYETAPNSSFNLGLTNVGVTATDAAGHSVSCYFQISVTARPEVCNGFDDDCDGLTDEAQDWARIAKQFASDGASLDEYGVSVAIDGDYAIVGSNKKGANGQNPGAAYILFRDKNGPNAWGQVAVLTDPNGMPGDNFGASVAIAGGVAAVGSPFDDTTVGNEGSVSIFYKSPSNPAQWVYHTKITIAGADGGDNLGKSVALSGDRLIAGATGDDAFGANAGAAYIFSRNQGGADNWGQVAKLLATTGNANDNFGASVDIDSDYAIVGANGVDGFQQDVGAAYIYGKNQFGPNTWGQVAKLQASAQNMNDNFGVSVAISGAWALVGADLHDRKATDAGAVFAFFKNQNGINDSWGQRSIIIDLNGKTGDRFGCAVGIDGEYAVVGAKGDDDQFGDDSGTGFVYLRQDNGFILMGNLEDGGGKAGDALGSSAAISNRNVILGAPLDDNPGSNMGSALVYGGLCNNLLNAEDRDVLPTGTAASLRCYPIPFSSQLNIELQGMSSPNAQVVVINTLGQTVAQLYNGAIEGDMTFQWRPYQVAAGVYFLRVSTEGEILAETIMLNR